MLDAIEEGGINTRDKTWFSPRAFTTNIFTFQKYLKANQLCLSSCL